jgi:hypothetical protein
MSVKANLHNGCIAVCKNDARPKIFESRIDLHVEGGPHFLADDDSEADSILDDIFSSDEDAKVYISSCY